MTVQISIKEVGPLWAIIIISIISLLVAYITFGILQSTGTYNNGIIQLGGATVGYLVVFISIYKAYSSQMDKARKGRLGELEEKLERETKCPSDILFSLVFGEDVKFDDLKENGHYWIKEGMEEKDDKLLLEFADPDPFLNWPGAWIWRPPVRISSKSTIKLELKEDNGRIWHVKKTPERITIPLRPVKAKPR